MVGTDTSPYHLELAPVEARYIVPRADDPAYLSTLNRLLAAERIDFLHAQPDAEVGFLARHRAEVGARTFLPRTETIELCQDKARFADAVRAAGLPSPEFAHVRSEDELRAATKRILQRHGKAWVRAVHGAGARASLPVTSPEQAVSWLRYWVEVKGLAPSDFMVTQFLPGREFAFQSLWQDGRLVTSQARERVEYLFGNLVPSGQTSTPSVARTVRRADVNELAIAAIHALDPNATGIFCADLKEDEHGVPLLTEINPGRFFTTSNFFAVAGLNMPYEYVRLGLGESPADLPERDGLEEGLYWVRMIDMGYGLVREGEWTSREVGT